MEQETPPVTLLLTPSLYQVLQRHANKRKIDMAQLCEILLTEQVVQLDHLRRPERD